jgi:hemerythrin-like domain-containing protein
MSDPTNRSTLKDALAEHEELRGVVAGLEGFLENPRPEIGQRGYHTWASELATRLVSLHDKLFRHFRSEEQGGLFEELAKMHPRASAKITSLGGEHGVILEGIRDVMSAALRYSEGKEPADPRLRQRVKKVLEMTSNHESVETELIHDLVYSDLGVGD